MMLSFMKFTFETFNLPWSSWTNGLLNQIRPTCALLADILLPHIVSGYIKNLWCLSVFQVTCYSGSIDKP